MKKPHEAAMDSIMDDMDNFETKKMFGEPEKMDGNAGVNITISVEPKQAGEPDGDEAAMNKGGMAGEYDKNCMSDGGMVEDPEDSEADLSLPPFLRKKKRI